jgi:DNA-binding NtrC family response regulator
MAASLKLLSFAKSGAHRQVRCCLEVLGYTVDSLDGWTWLDRSNRLGGTTVALFSTPVPDQALLPDLLDRIDASSTLTLLAGQGEVDEGLLCFSDELAFWPCASTELDRRLRRLCQRAGTSEPIPDACPAPDCFEQLNLIGHSPQFKAVLASIKRISAFDLPILLQGETGTGKELLARAIHYLGPRQNGAFIPVNCGSIPADLIESELYGHAKGAFTDAKRTQSGLVELADGGTLFLDEIDSLSSRGQVSLLRFLQNQEFRPLGGRSFKQANVRIVAAGNRPLRELVEQGEFREDLYYRLGVFPIELPPLRRRDGDVLELAGHFLSRYSRLYGKGLRRFSPEALSWLDKYPWPGNVRELENAVHRACLLAGGEQITPRTLTPELPSGGDCQFPADTDPETLQLFAVAKQHAVERFERSYLETVMQRTGGNVSAAARLAGKERRAFGKLLKKHGLCRQRYS